MPTKGESFFGGELFDAEGNKIMTCDAAEVTVAEPEDEALEREFAEIFKDYSFSCTFNPVINKKTQKLIDKQTNIMNRHKRRIQRKVEQKRREMLKAFGPEKYHIMRSAIKILQVYYYKLRNDRLPIEYVDGNYKVRIAIEGDNIHVTATENYNGPIEVSFQYE